MQRFDQAAAQAWLRGLFSWREKRSGMIAPDERLPWAETTAMGFQHVLAMFGATVLAPILMGFDPNTAIFFSGIGTLIFFFATGGKIPSYLGSSFAFIAPVAAVTGTALAFNPDDIPKALGGIVIAGLLYTVIGLVVHFTGSDWIDALMPPIVTGGVVAIIGLNLAGVARDMAETDMTLAIITILAILVIALIGRGLLGRLPILLGTAFGYLLALILGGTNAEGRDILGLHISGVDLGPVGDASLIGFPNFQAPSFEWGAISLIAPVAVVLVAENTGHIKAVSEMTKQNMMPYLGRGFAGDGVATMVAGLGGGTGVTTYAENIGVMAVTRVFSTAIFLISAGVAILLGFSPMFGALINSIPLGVLGGVSTVLFGLIAAAGVRIWIDNQVDFSKGINLFIAAVTLIVGAADYTVNFGEFALNGIALGTFGSIILYQVFRRAPGAMDDDPGATPASFSDPYDDFGIGREESRRSRGAQPMQRGRQERPARQSTSQRFVGSGAAMDDPQAMPPRQRPPQGRQPRRQAPPVSRELDEFVRDEPADMPPPSRAQRPDRPQPGQRLSRHERPGPPPRQGERPREEFGDVTIDDPYAMPRQRSPQGQPRRQAPPSTQQYDDFRLEKSEDIPSSPRQPQPPQGQRRPRPQGPRQQGPEGGDPPPPRRRR